MSNDYDEFVMQRINKYPFLCYTPFDTSPKPNQVSTDEYGHFMRYPMRWKNCVMWGFAYAEGRERFQAAFRTIEPTVALVGGDVRSSR